MNFNIYKLLLENRIILLTGEITDELSTDIIAKLLYLSNNSQDDIYLYINSPGGSITAGMAIYDTMNFIKCDVSTICVGLAASMASFLLAAGAKSKRYALPNSEIMIHQPLGGVKGQATDIDIQAKRILKIKEKMNKILANLTNQDLNKVIVDCERDCYLDPIEALNYGLIDKVLDK